MIKQTGTFRTGIAPAAMLLLPLFTAACDRHNASSGQTVATVNDEPITTSELQLELSNLPPDQQAQSRALAIQTLIDRKLMTQYAKQQKIERGSDYVLQQQRMDNILLAQSAAQRIAAAAQQPISVNEVNRYLDDHPEMASNRRLLTLDQITFPMPDAATAAELKNAQTIADVVAILNRHGGTMTHDQVEGDTATLTGDLAKQLNALKPGEPLIIFNRPNSTANVVIGSKQAPLEGEAAADAARQRINAQRANDAVQQRGLAMRSQATISYSKGYAPSAKGKTGK